MFSRPPLSTLFPYTTLFDLPYEVAAVVEIQPVGRGVRMVVTEDAMHDELWTERSTMGMNSSLDRLAKVLEARLGKRSEEHTSELQSLRHLVCRLLLEKKKKH